MNLMYAMAAAIIAAFTILFLPIGDGGQRVMIAGLLIAAVPILLIAGVLRMQRGR